MLCAKWVSLTFQYSKQVLCCCSSSSHMPSRPLTRLCRSLHISEKNRFWRLGYGPSPITHLLINHRTRTTLSVCLSSSTNFSCLTLLFIHPALSTLSPLLPLPPSEDQAVVTQHFLFNPQLKTLQIPQWCNLHIVLGPLKVNVTLASQWTDEMVKSTFSLTGKQYFINYL